MKNDYNFIAYDENTVFNNFRKFVDINDKKILEVGGNMDENIIFQYGVDEWISVDPKRSNFISNNKKYICKKLPLLECKLNKDYFDIIFSSNAFEHITNFNQNLSYMYRVLRSGGYLFSQFGPIWSAPDGHHLEDVKLKNGEYLNFWENNIIPNWYHLICTKNELLIKLQELYDFNDAKRIVDYVYESEYLNRLFFKDYIKAFLDTGFQIQFLSTSSCLDYKINAQLSNNISVQQSIDLLKNMYGNDDFKCRDITVLLKK